MKKGTYLLIALLSFINLSATIENGVNYQNNDAITFIEKGVEFHVFLNGNFDFNTINNNTYYNNRRPQVFTDNFGRIRQVGNTVINYGHYGNVTGIGNVPIRYQHGQLTSVGNLFVEYDRWGYPHYRGFVRQNRFYNTSIAINANYGNVWVYDNPYFYDRHFRNSYRRVREDANFFYYRAIPNAKLGNRSQLIKRRKPNRTIIESNRRYTNNKRVNRNSNNFNRNNKYKANTTRKGNSTPTRSINKKRVVKSTPTSNRNNNSYNSRANTIRKKASTPTRSISKKRVVKTTSTKNRRNNNYSKGTDTTNKKTVIQKRRS